jgi:hypothetical protein
LGLKKGNISVNNEKLIPDIDAEQLKEIAKKFSISKPSRKMETIDFLLNSLEIEYGQVKNTDLFLRNYIYSTIIVRKHLIEIRKRQSLMKKHLKKITENKAYAYKKLNYFQQQNEKAKADIINFICLDIGRFVEGIRSSYFDLIDRNQEQDMWKHGPVYDYLYNAQYYDPEYDFSTFVKFYNIPDVKGLEVYRNIEKHIELKKTSPELYQEEIIKTVDENDMMCQIAKRVSSNYHVRERKEIFDAMATLFKEEKYLTFITMAIIQIEGLFYDLACIKTRKKETSGNLSEKIANTFKDDPILAKNIYPYFAFDIPGLRNEIAHKGIMEGQERKQTAYGLVLDLNCLLCLTEEASTDKFKKFIIIYDKLNKIEEGEYKNYEEYGRAITECFVEELYLNKIIKDESFWELLLNPAKYEEEMDYYRSDDLKDDEACLKDMVYFISNMVKSGLFWNAVNDICNSLSSDNSRIIQNLLYFFDLLKGKFMPVLKGEAKIKCCQISKKLSEMKKK